MEQTMPKAAEHPTPKVRPTRAKPPQNAAKRDDLAATAAHEFEAVPSAEEAIATLGEFLAELHASHQTLRMCLLPTTLSATQMTENMRDADEREIMDMIDAGAWVADQGKRLRALAEFCSSAGARMFIVAARLAMAPAAQAVQS